MNTKYIDIRPGNYYVSVIDGKRHGFLAGPFDSHAEALSFVHIARHEAYNHDPRAPWYDYGTARAPDDYTKPGVLNALLGI